MSPHLQPLGYDIRVPQRGFASADVLWWPTAFDLNLVPAIGGNDTGSWGELWASFPRMMREAKRHEIDLSRDLVIACHAYDWDVDSEPTEPPPADLRRLRWGWDVVDVYLGSALRQIVRHDLALNAKGLFPSYRRARAFAAECETRVSEEPRFFPVRISRVKVNGG